MRIRRSIFLAGMLGLWCSVAAFAQEQGQEAPKTESEKQEPSEAPAAAEPEPLEASAEAEIPEFPLAMEALLLGEHLNAARLAYVALNKTKAGTEKYESTQFVLAESLRGAGFTQAAAEYYFTVIEQRTNPALLPRALEGIERMTRERYLDEDLLLRGVIVDADLANVPVEIANFLNYYRGLSNLRLGYKEWADSDFASVSGEAYYAQLSRYVNAVDLVRENKFEEASKIVDELLAKEDLDPEIRSKISVMRSRVWYEAGKTKEAIEEYRKTDKSIDATQGELLLERAWAHFRAGDYHDAMGLLYALGAPSSKRLFLPDQYVIRGLIYQRFCHFRAAKAAVRDFRDRYLSAVAELKEGVLAHEVEMVARAAETQADVGHKLHIFRLTKNEKAEIDEERGKLSEGGLDKHLEEIYAQLEIRAETRYKRSLQEGAKRMAERLLEADEQANLLDYEVGVSIFKPIAPATGVVKLRAPAEKVPSSGPKVYFPFDGEFWSDELPDFRFLIQDRCVE